MWHRSILVANTWQTVRGMSRGFELGRECQGAQPISVLILVPSRRYPRSQAGPSTPNTTCKLPPHMALPPGLPPHPGRSIILPLCTPTRRLPMQNHTLVLLHMPTQVPVIIGLAGKLRCRQFRKYIIIRNESPSPIITKSLFIQSLNDASVLNDLFICGVHSLKEILSKYMDHALGLGGVDKVEAIFDERVVEGYDVVVVLESGDEASDDFPGGFDLRGLLVIWWMFECGGSGTDFLGFLRRRMGWWMP